MAIIVLKMELIVQLYHTIRYWKSSVKAEWVVVYKADDIRLKRTVALKFLPPELTSDPKAKHRLVHEAQATSSLQHNNICAIHDIDETEEGQVFIVLDCYEGESLKDKIARGPLRMDEVLDISVQTCAAMARAHAKGIVHGRLDPSAIFITTDGMVKLLDFGLAEFTAKQTTPVSQYTPPEQIEGGIPDKQVDISAFGVVLHEMITGHLPFKNNDEQTLRYSITSEEPDYEHRNIHRQTSSADR